MIELVEEAFDKVAEAMEVGFTRWEQGRRYVLSIDMPIGSSLRIRQRA
jgi:hypothetical protein